MTIEFISPVGRFVQGSISLETKTDQQTGKPKLDDKGQEIKECYIGLAIRKDDPGLPAFYQQFVQAARTDFPHLFNEQGQCTHPQFAWKIQDGDGVDQSGKSVKDKPGFAGCFVFKFGTRYLPKCFHYGKYDQAQQILNPTEVIKRGYYIRVAGTLRGNGVTPQDRTNKPGLFASPNLIELVAFGEEIQGGPDAAKVLGGAALNMAALPPGASQVPMVAAAGAPSLPGLPGLPTGAPTLPGLPQMPTAAPSLPAMPQMPAAAPALPQMPAMPQVPAGPTYTMLPAAQGATREALLAAGWNDAALVQHGLMVIG